MVIEIITTYPRTSIIIIGCLVTLVSALVTTWLTDQDHMRTLKKRQKAISKEIKEWQKKGDHCAMEKLNKEVLEITGVMMKSQFKPLLVTIVPFLLLFHWMRGIFTPIMDFSWFWYYFATSIISNMIYRKVFKLA